MVDSASPSLCCDGSSLASALQHATEQYFMRVYALQATAVKDVLVDFFDALFLLCFVVDVVPPVPPSLLLSKSLAPQQRHALNPILSNALRMPGRSRIEISFAFEFQVGGW